MINPMVESTKVTLYNQHFIHKKPKQPVFFIAHVEVHGFTSWSFSVNRGRFQVANCFSSGESEGMPPHAGYLALF